MKSFRRLWAQIFPLLVLFAACRFSAACQSEQRKSGSLDFTDKQIRTMSDRSLLEIPIAPPNASLMLRCDAELRRRGIQVLPTIEACLEHGTIPALVIRCAHVLVYLPSEEAGPRLVDRLRRSHAGEGGLTEEGERMLRPYIYYALGGTKYYPAVSYLEELHNSRGPEDTESRRIAWAIWELSGRKIGPVMPPRYDPDHPDRERKQPRTPRWNQRARQETAIPPRSAGGSTTNGARP